jgi:hypothetical protein
MRRQIVRTQISLDLDQPAPQRLPIDFADKKLAQHLARDHRRVAGKERYVQYPLLRPCVCRPLRRCPSVGFADTSP